MMRKTGSDPKQGQITLEYFIIFAVVALITLVGLTAFDDNVRASLQGVFRTVAERIASPEE